MKNAEIYAVASGHPPGYVWRWRCTDATDASGENFEFYYDCVCAARARGHRVELTRAIGHSAPSGPVFKLHARQDAS